MKIYIRTDLERMDEKEVETLIMELPEWRRKQAIRFKFLSGKCECATSYLLLCRALRECYGIEEKPRFGYLENGKPYLVGYPNIHFNLSHCKNAVVCAVSNSPIGVDIERKRHANDDLIRYTMNDEEIEQIDKSKDKDYAFTKLWTKKEAFVKLTGLGIQDNIKDILKNIDYSKIVIDTMENDEKLFAYSVAYRK